MSTDSGNPTWRELEAIHANLIVDAINEIRHERGYTVKELGRRLNELGWPITLNTLNGILTPVRKRGSFSVDEVFAFAKALDVPVSRIVPPLHDDLYRLAVAEARASLIKALQDAP